MSLVENNQNPSVKTPTPSGKGNKDHDCLGHLFVWRDELQKLIEFATDPQVSRRLRTVAGPPGYGKSCLLGRLSQNLKPFREFLVIRTPASDQVKSFSDLEDWLYTVVEQAKEKCPEVEAINLNASPEAIIAHLLEKLCETCNLTWRIILIVDALDELPENICRALENRFLESFWRRECVRIIISFRDEFSLKSPKLRHGEQRIALKPFSDAQGREQIKKRSKFLLDPHKISFKALEKLVHPYKFNLPGLTTILLQKIRINERVKKNPVLTSADVRSARQELINQPLARSAGYAAILEKDLKALVLHQQDSWTQEEFARVCGYSDLDAFRHLQDLMALRVVVPHPDYLRRYKVVDGLRELLRAELRMKREENS